jgi:translation initiation factor IF-2
MGNDVAGKARIHELAKELGVTSKEILAHLAADGERVKSASSTVEAPVARRVRAAYGSTDRTTNTSGRDTQLRPPPAIGEVPTQNAAGKHHQSASIRTPPKGAKQKQQPAHDQRLHPPHKTPKTLGTTTYFEYPDRNQPKKKKRRSATPETSAPKPDPTTRACLVTVWWLVWQRRAGVAVAGVFR